YTHMLAVAGLATTLFLGGWHGPFLPGPLWFLVKVFVLVFVFIWVRATYPRLRYDQIMKLGWKVLIPLTILNLVVTAFIVAVR
ncbi:MAG: NADH-quinone oxidoreductase subunit H, partial [Deltaproteobacteria bacterium]|nr:NADH-quinone oxidoreductase subunit H [Deltaproteobacteria bacterium]